MLVGIDITPPVSQALLWKVVKEHVDGPEFMREQQAEIQSIFDDEKEKHKGEIILTGFRLWLMRKYEKGIGDDEFFESKGLSASTLGTSRFSNGLQLNGFRVTQIRVVDKPGGKEGEKVRLKVNYSIAFAEDHDEQQLPLRILSASPVGTNVGQTEAVAKTMAYATSESFISSATKKRRRPSHHQTEKRRSPERE